jgi:hypothetical protein
MVSDLVAEVLGAEGACVIHLLMELHDALVIGVHRLLVDAVPVPLDGLILIARLALAL